MGCTSLLYLNLAGTPISDASLRFLGRCVLLNVWIQFFNLNSSRVCFFFIYVIHYAYLIRSETETTLNSPFSPASRPHPQHVFPRFTSATNMCCKLIGSLNYVFCDWLTGLSVWLVIWALRNSIKTALWVKEMLICVAVVSVRYCTNMLYLSLANCTKFTNKGLSYMANGKGCHKIVHLDLSGCEQVCGNFTKIFDLGLQFRDRLV